jgi:hypothetical protein
MIVIFRVARLFICKSKMAILVYFEGLGVENFIIHTVWPFSILRPFGVFHDH